jgi:hypothetical protein
VDTAIVKYNDKREDGEELSGDEQDAFELLYNLKDAAEGQLGK